MLTQIYVKNFILMDEVQLELHDNMSAFTGETGAGKSLLMDAIGILKGDRVNSDMIKEGCDKAVIEGVFELAPQHSVLQQLQDAGHECEDGLLIGKSPGWFRNRGYPYSGCSGLFQPGHR